MTKTKKSDQITVEAQTPATDTLTSNVATTIEVATDSTVTNVNNFKAHVAKAVDADSKGQSFRSRALRSLSLIGLETMTDDILTPSDITTYAQEVLCPALSVDWKDVAEADALLSTRGIYKEVLWVLTYLNATGAACDPDGNEGKGICITDGKKNAGMIWLRTKYIPQALREDDPRPTDKFSFKKVLMFAKAHFAKVQPKEQGSHAARAFTLALSFATNIVLAYGEVKDDYPDDTALPGDAERLVEKLLEMATWMNEEIQTKKNHGTRDVTKVA
jgi:hypothetical protein